MNGIDAQLLAQILAANGADVGGYQVGRGNAIWDPNKSADQQDPNAFERVIYGNTSKDGWTTNKWDTWNQDGSYRGSGSGDSDALSTLKFLATAAAGYFGGNALANSMAPAATTAAAGGAEAAGGSALDALLAGGGYGADAGTLVGGSALTSGGTAGLGTTLGDVGIMSAAGGGGFGGSLGGAMGGAMGGGAAAGGGASAPSAGGSSLSNMAKAASGSGLNAGSLLGAIAGAADGGDKQQTSSRDPWAPAQDFLKQQIGQGQALATQYQQQPFSAAQQTAYGNLGGLLDTINKNAGGLLGGFNAAASGANNYDRSNPRRQLTGGAGLGQMDLSSYMPGLLGNFGTRKG